jgi:hypothetical protein
VAKICAGALFSAISGRSPRSLRLKAFAFA